MTQSVPPPPPPLAPTPKDDRQARLAEQLRANLHRRKAQARAVAAGDAQKTDLPKV